MAFLVPDKITTVNGVTVKEYLFTTHNPNRIHMPSKRSNECIGVTIHNTGIINAAKGTTMSEQYSRATVNGNMNSVRVHYYVDDVEAWQNLPLDWQSWHAGQSGKAEANGSIAGNGQTISIECIMGAANGYEKAEDNAARLAAYLLDTFGLDINHLYTHNYWCNVRKGLKGTVDELNTINDGYKNCPIYIRPHWAEFKAKVTGYMHSREEPAPKSKEYTVKVVCDELNVRASAGTGAPVTCKIRKGEVYTISAETTVGTVPWGKLKSGAGWISLLGKYVVKV